MLSSENPQTVQILFVDDAQRWIVEVWKKKWSVLERAEK
jgi:hypothetical protein